jgi:heavy metal sensor kinase
MRVTSIRLRLTLWYALSLAIVLFVFGAGTYLFVQEKLYSQVDKQLDSELLLIKQSLDKPLDEFKELEAHAFITLFMVEQDGWPTYISSGWEAADLDYALRGAPMDTRWIWQSPSAQYFHIKRTRVTFDNHQYSFTVALDSDQIHDSLHGLLLALIIGAPLALVVGLGGGYFLAGRSLAPIQLLTRRARAISAENLAERLTVPNPHDELGQLTAVLNDMFTRLEDSFVRLRRFTQDAAHELRTPLAVLRSVGEVGLQHDRDPKDYRDVIGSMLEEVDRLGRLVEGLLTLARAESGRIPVQRQPEDLCVLSQNVVECLLVLAEDKQQTLRFEATGSAFASLDRDTLRLALMNLVANAIRFTPERGDICVRVSLHAEGAIAVEIKDNGPGIATEHHIHLFERFYRVDQSRSYESGGTGLGLAIALWAVEVNGGRIELESTPGEGCLFRILLPAIR